MGTKTTNKDISRAIEALTGVPGVKVFAHCGLCRFYSDDPLLDLSSLESVYAATLNTYTPQQWADLFEDAARVDKPAPSRHYQTLLEHIAEKYNGVQADFARANGVQRQQVTQWINAGFLVLDGRLYSPRRRLK